MPIFPSNHLSISFIGFWTVRCVIAAPAGNERHHKTWSVLFPSVQALFTTIALLHLG